MSPPFTLHRDLVWPVRFAGKLASDRNSQVIEICDLWSGIYLAEFERISVFFENCCKVEKVLYEECHLDKPRWFYSCSLYDELRNTESLQSKYWSYSARLTEVFLDATTLAKKRQPETQTPRIALEDMLVTLLAQSDIAVCRRLSEAGLVKRSGDL